MELFVLVLEFSVLVVEAIVLVFVDFEVIGFVLKILDDDIFLVCLHAVGGDEPVGVVGVVLFV